MFYTNNPTSHMIKTKNRLLIITPDFPPKAGGVSLAAQELANKFTSLKYDVHVLTVASITLPAPESDNGMRVTRLTPDIMGGERASETIIKSTLQSFQPHCIIINGTNKKFIYNFPYHLADLNNIPILYRSHGATTALPLFFRWNKPPFFGIKSWLLSFIETRAWVRRCASFAQIVFLSSQQGVSKNYDRKLASRWHLKNVSDIPNTFESIRLQENSFCKKYAIQGTVFSYIAGFSIRKNQIGAIRAIKDSDLTDITFVFIGPERNEYAAQAEKLAARDSRFVFLYDIPRQDVIEAQNASDCCFLYATHEQQPLVILEAMSCQKPWICTDVGSVSEMQGGIVLKNRKKKDLVQAIKTMQDYKTRERLGKMGLQQWQAQFSPESVYARWETMLSDIVAHRPIRGGY